MFLWKGSGNERIRKGVGSLLAAVICQYAFPTVQAIKEGATGGWRKMERESHKTLRHQPHPFLAKGDFY